MPRSTVIGGFVLVGSLRAAAITWNELLASPVSIDRSNRIDCNWCRSNVKVVSTHAADARPASQSASDWHRSMSIERNPKQELTSAIDFAFHPQDTNPVPFHKVLLPLWSRCGFAPFKGVIDEAGGHFSFVWQDERTRDELIVPLEVNRSIHLRVSDRTDTSDIAQKVEDAGSGPQRSPEPPCRRQTNSAAAQTRSVRVGSDSREIKGRLPTGPRPERLSPQIQ